MPTEAWLLLPTTCQFCACRFEWFWRWVKNEIQWRSMKLLGTQSDVFFLVELWAKIGFGNLELDSCSLLHLQPLFSTTGWQQNSIFMSTALSQHFKNVNISLNETSRNNLIAPLVRHWKKGLVAEGYFLSCIAKLIICV